MKRLAFSLSFLVLAAIHVPAVAGEVSSSRSTGPAAVSADRETDPQIKWSGAGQRYQIARVRGGEQAPLFLPAAAATLPTLLKLEFSHRGHLMARETISLPAGHGRGRVVELLSWFPEQRQILRRLAVAEKGSVSVRVEHLGVSISYDLEHLESEIWRVLDGRSSAVGHAQTAEITHSERSPSRFQANGQDPSCDEACDYHFWDCIDHCDPQIAGSCENCYDEYNRCMSNYKEVTYQEEVYLWTSMQGGVSCLTASQAQGAWGTLYDHGVDTIRVDTIKKTTDCTGTRYEVLSSEYVNRECFVQRLDSFGQPYPCGTRVMYIPDPNLCGAS